MTYMLVENRYPVTGQSLIPVLQAVFKETLDTNINTPVRGITKIDTKQYQK